MGRPSSVTIERQAAGRKSKLPRIRKRYAIAGVAVLAVSAFGWLWKGSASLDVVTPDGVASFATVGDGAPYEPGGSVAVELKNLGMSDVGYNLCFVEFERLQSSRWKEVKDPDRVCLTYMELLAPRRSVRGEIEIPDGLAPGTYRLSLAVRLGRGPGLHKISSPSFEVWDPQA